MSTARRAGGRRLTAVLVTVLLVVPLLEVTIIIAVGRTIGGWQTFGLLLLESALGAWLVRREGARAWAALSTALSTGRMPAGELADAALVLVGGTLLLTPGFLTDVLGFAFVLPFTRPFARLLVVGLVERRLLAATAWGAWRGGSQQVVPGSVVPPRDAGPGRDGPDGGGGHRPGTQNGPGPA